MAPAAAPNTVVPNSAAPPAARDADDTGEEGFGDLGFFSVASTAEEDADIALPEESDTVGHDTGSAAEAASDVDSQLGTAAHSRPPPPPPPASRVQHNVRASDLHAPSLKEIETNRVTRLAARYWAPRNLDFMAVAAATADAMQDDTGAAGSARAKKGRKAATPRRQKGKRGAEAEAPTDDDGDAQSAAGTAAVRPAFDAELVSKIWKEELVASGFALQPIMLLEFSQYLEEYLWPNYNPEESSLDHTLSIVVMLNEKYRERIPGVWMLVTSDEPKFSAFFSKVLHLQVEHEDAGLDLLLRRFLLVFLINAFQSLENSSVRSECLRLVSIGIWRQLDGSAARNALFSEHPHLRKAWNKNERKLSQMGEEEKTVALFQHAFLSNMIIDFFRILESIPENGPVSPNSIAFCERLAARAGNLDYQGWGSNGSDSGVVFVELLERLQFFASFEIDDYTGSSLTASDAESRYYSEVQKLQKLCFQNYRGELEELALSCIKTLETKEALSLQFTKVELFDDVRLPASQSFTNTHCMPAPKLNMQFLTLHDYLLRNFELFRLETAYEIRLDVEDVVKRIAPAFNQEAPAPSHTSFTGWARMGVALEKFDIVDIGPVAFGRAEPMYIKADISFHVGRYTDVIRREWDALRKHDVLFLVTLQVLPDSGSPSADMPPGPAFCRRFGVRHIRGCEVLDVLSSNREPIDEFDGGKMVRQQTSRRFLRVLLDPNQYYQDMQRIQKKETDDIYASFNLLVRRKPQENNFKAVLETIRDLMQSDIVVPDWLQDVFLGYGDPRGATPGFAANPVLKQDFRDTFLDWEHLVESFKQKVVPIQGNAVSSDPIDPPYILTFPASDYENENMGPYPEDIPKRNLIRFTPTQVDAVRSGMSPGLTMIVGPPGTGKTDVAVQIIANLYHNYPEENILLITHSNQALNQLFEKIIDLNIDPRHLLRLGHGMDELQGDWGKYGRVNTFLEKRIQLLAEVDRLAMSLGIAGAHGSTCETAGYFFTYRVQSYWQAFRSSIQDKTVDVASVFPFSYFFYNAPQPLFPPNSTREEAIDIAEGCYRHIRRIFSELEELRAFELLRNGHDRSNYLLVKEAKIVALTCTHAAIKRRELVALGFRYDNVIVEEAAQILEVETFIPLLLQSPEPETGKSRLRRVVMIGDHNQLPPVVKNVAFQRYGNMEQSLFARFLRLGVPAITLDRQARSRKGIADLFRWKYPGLGDMESVLDASEFRASNAGFAFDFQMINVEDYNGAGETEPVPHFVQNLGEAEYVVALFQYMRLLGYPAKSIVILTTYNGQKALIEDVLERRCRWNPLFGLPQTVSTVDKFQGQQSDYVLLSLVRTRTVGHLRDVRRLVVALSRARLGLYVVCRRRLFETCVELRPALAQLLHDRPGDSLWLRGGEAWGVGHTRPVEDTGVVRAEPPSTTSGRGRVAGGAAAAAAWKPAESDTVFEIVDVAHLGAYVHQMITEQIEYMREQKREREAKAATAAAAAVEVEAETGAAVKAPAVADGGSPIDSDEAGDDDDDAGDVSGAKAPEGPAPAAAAADDADVEMAERGDDEDDD
ncbi:hypothetical protein HK405_004599 [Cladochytrium tenue]|nr:hypothetical protein HK405_004599 [Cladochytrium tenue]